ncbi:MAG TPA: YkgJ family cysteine cluster protein [Dissulfurispiraceae bacterium]|nr:YkgJ family cysteine cluster protein [Dissulfurispiraceae bacterium]
MPNKNKTDKFEILTTQGGESGDRPKKKKFVKKTECDRCGSCCTESTPSLLKEDMPLFRSSVLSFDNTFTIREGEQFVVKGEDEPYRAFMELIKIKPKEGTGECIFYNNNEGCTIYERRPSQCAAFACWELSDAMTGLQQKALQRKDLFGDIELVSELIARQEERCSYDKLGDALEKALGGDEAAAEEIVDMLQYDNFIRSYVTEKFNIPVSSLDLVFGKPMTERILDFGVKVEKEGDEYILLPVNNKEGL